MEEALIEYDDMSERKKELRRGELQPVWPDWAIYWTLGNFLKPLATITLSKSSTFLGNFCKGVKLYHFSLEIIFGHTGCNKIKEGFVGEEGGNAKFATNNSSSFRETKKRVLRATYVLFLNNFSLFQFLG